MNYDTSKYRALGIGERIERGDFWITDENQTPAPVDVTAGMLVGQDDPATWLRPLEPKTAYQSGAKRNDATGKGRFDLVPYEGILYAARHYEYGVEQGYEPRNWEKGIPLSRFLSSMRRHSHQVGYCFREQHVGAVLFNAMGFAATVERIRDGRLPRDLDDIGYLAAEEASR